MNTWAAESVRKHVVIKKRLRAFFLAEKLAFETVFLYTGFIMEANMLFVGKDIGIMRMKERLLSVLLVILLTFAFVPAASSATVDYTLRIDGGDVPEHTETVDGQDCLRVDVYLDGATSAKPVSTLAFDLAYDKDQITCVKSEALSANDAFAVVNANETGLIRFGFISAYGTVISESAPIMTLWFAVAEGLPAGTEIGFSVSGEIDAVTFTTQNNYVERTVGTDLRPYLIPGEDAVPEFKTQSLLLSGQIGLNFYMELPEGAGAEYEDSYMTFEISGEGTITERDDFDRGCMNSTGKYYGFTCYVSSIQMADTITATYHYRKDGTEKTVEKTYAVKEYFSAYDEKIAPSASAELTTLVHAVADYGHYAQLYLSEQNGWEIGTAYAEMDKYYTTSYDLDSIAGALARYAVVKVNETNGDLDAITCTIVMDSDTTIRILLKPSAGYTEVPAVTIGTESVTPVLQSDGRYRIEIRNLPAQMLSNMYTISVTTANGSATINVSVLSGANSMAGSTKTATKNAGAAIYSYSKAADEYMGN